MEPLLPGTAHRGPASTRPIEDFLWRIEHQHVREGGFALVHGDPGTGKSVALRLLCERLERLADVSVAVLNHPQSNLADFYRELGELFGVELKPHNRWGGFKSLRERWLTHLEGTRLRPMLLIDEAQEMAPATLSELRLLASTRFDSRPLLGIVLAAHQTGSHFTTPPSLSLRTRLPEKVRDSCLTAIVGFYNSLHAAKSRQCQSGTSLPKRQTQRARLASRPLRFASALRSR